ncbi:MAG: class I SAM-dependent methyltransferase [Bradymonadaceae bacterium]|nr:class I SAM-dependent methyltransferase [Lujinxingiaceae bacterium]
MTQEAQYPSWLYRLIHQGNEGDVAFYVDACSEAKTILELGCGFGRVLVALAEAGHLVTGVDSHAGLLAETAGALAMKAGRKDRATLLEGDMRTVSFKQRFDRVILPYNGLFCLQSDAEVRDCFENVARHLAPDGLFIFDVYAAECLFEDAATIDEEVIVEEPELLSELKEDGADITVYESSVWTPGEQRYDVSYRYEIKDGAGERVQTHTIAHRYMLLDQITALLAECGLRVALALGDFEGRGFDEESDQLIVVASIAKK